MAERTSIAQLIQIGVESTPGTSVSATKKFQATSIEPSIRAEVDRFRPMGTKYETFVAENKEWVEARLSGKLNYTEIVYLLSSLVDTATISTPAMATNTRNWNFTSDATSEDTPKTFTVEHGSSVRADKFTYGLVTELGMSFNRNSCEFTGGMIGQRLTDGITMTSMGVTTVALEPVIANQVSVYIDTTSGGLGGTKLTRALSTEWHLGSRYNPLWVLDAANSSWVAAVETAPDLTMNLTVEADSEGMGQLTNLRSGDTVWARIEAVGDLIESTFYNKLTIDMPVKLVGTGGFSDQDGVYAVEWNFVGVYDSTWGKPFDINVRNTLTAL